MNSLSFTIYENSAGLRIDKWLSENETSLTRSAIQKLIEDGNVLINSNKVNKNYKLRIDDKVDVTIPDPVELDVKAQDLPLEFIYQDEDLAIINKPKGMVVHPAAGNPDGTLVNALMYHCKGQLSGINGVIRPGIVHRIDKDTSGLLIIAKNDFAHVNLAQQIKQHSFSREYQAIVCGKVREYSGTINAPIGRDKKDRKKMCITDHNSKEAVTHYEVIQELKNSTLVKFKLETGRTHQIRVHSTYVGHSVYGDGVYGKAIKGVQGQCLHAKTIGFVHPRTGEYLEFDSELPEYFKTILNKLRI